MIKIVEGTKTFENKYKGLKNISIDISNSGLYLFSGSSGSGKTTLLNCLVGIDTFDVSKTQNIIPSGQAAIVFQDYQLIEHFTIYENALFILEINGDKDVRKIDHALKKLNLYEWKDHKSSELSGGQKQRVSILRAFLSNKPIIVADEPTGNLDLKQSLEIAKILKEISETRIVLVSSHDLNIFEALANEIFLIEDGTIKSHHIKSENSNKPIISNKNSTEKLTFKHIFRFATKGYSTQKSKALILIFTLVFSFILALTALNIMNNNVYKIKEKRYKSEEIEYLELVSFDNNGGAISIEDSTKNELIKKYNWDDYMEFIEIFPNKIPVILNKVPQKIDINRIYLTDEIKLKTISDQKKIEDNDVFISYKIAKQIIEKNNMAEIKELLNTEITINNTVLRIVNIIDEDKEYSLNLSNNEKDVLIKIEQAIYLNENTFIKISNKTIRDRVMLTTNSIDNQIERRITNYNDAFHKELFLGDATLSDNDVIISYQDALSIAKDENLENLLNKELEVVFYKYIFGNRSYTLSERKTFNIKGILVDSFEQIPWIFSDESYLKISYNYGLNNYKNSSLNGISINNYSKSLLEDLDKLNIRDYSYSSLDINVTDEYISSISNIIIVIGGILILVSALIILSYINNSIIEKTPEIGLLRSFNIKLRQITFIFIVEIMILLVSVFIVSIISEIFIIQLFNKMLINQGLISFNYIYYSLYSPLMLTALLLILTFVFSLMIISKLRTKTSIQLIRYV
ncbi:ABC transporter ATP-binding protein/permease [Haploplasma axanthum]|uniref:ABC transporter ATPase n=1 Tax=Haploplasma axanthum TaxID=29552 RepID=A0A449BDJ4_HAPAX|nr:ATP-binding cassette domain-containing protein [Haploplasma axanthum]VEU80524.1 ABC transporter ATPase [Haploplasma axanthum]